MSLDCISSKISTYIKSKPSIYDFYLDNKQFRSCMDTIINSNNDEEAIKHIVETISVLYTAIT